MRQHMAEVGTSALMMKTDAFYVILQLRAPQIGDLLMAFLFGRSPIICMMLQLLNWRRN